MRILVLGCSPAALALLAALASLPAAAADNSFDEEDFDLPPPQTVVFDRPEVAELPRPSLAPPPQPALPAAPRQLAACRSRRPTTATNPNGPHTGPPRR
jgi:hypothetical protein